MGPLVSVPMLLDCYEWSGFWNVRPHSCTKMTTKLLPHPATHEAELLTTGQGWLKPVRVNIKKICTERSWFRKGKYQKFCEGSNQFCKALCKIGYFPLLQWWGEKINLGWSFFFDVWNFRKFTVLTRFRCISFNKTFPHQQRILIWLLIIHGLILYQTWFKCFRAMLHVC